MERFTSVDSPDCEKVESMFCILLPLEIAGVPEHL